MLEHALQSMLHNAAFAPLPQLTWLRLTGDDRVRWLNGMVTNSIATLKPGEGNYNFFLSAQGRIQGDALAFVMRDSILLQTDAGRLPALTALLDRFIIMDDVELQPVPEWAGLAVIGPDAESVLSQLGFPSLAGSGVHLTEHTWKEAATSVVTTSGPLVPRFELWADAATFASLAEALSAAGIPQAVPADLNQLRILEGTPLYGTDIRDKELPQETASAGTQSRALHFSKGCYLGQEIVERIHSRGNVHRVFSGFLLTGEQPDAGASLTTAEAPEKAVGELTSVTSLGGELYALGYLRREALERGLSLIYPGGTAQPVGLPFSPPPL